MAKVQIGEILGRAQGEMMQAGQQIAGGAGQGIREKMVMLPHCHRLLFREGKTTDGRFDLS